MSDFTIQGTRTCHQKSGCLICGQTDGCLVSTETDCSCEWHQTLREYDRAFIELKIRRFAMDDPLFPDLRVRYKFCLLVVFFSVH